MNKLVPFAALVLSIVAIPSAAMALETHRDFSVTETSRGHTVDVGTIRFTLEGAMDREDEHGNTVPVCRYVGRWTNAAQVPSRTNLFVDEISTAGYADCDENAHDFFDTIVVLANDVRSRGFDPRQQRRIIDDMFLEEFESGMLDGVIDFADGNSYRLTLER